MSEVFLAVFISKNEINKIKYSSDIVDVISDYVILKKSGNNYFGLCPFHTEKTPSFAVDPSKQIFHCYGCKTSGDVISFLMQIESISFVDAANKLSMRYGIIISSDNKTHNKAKEEYSKKEKMLEINKTALSFYIENLKEERAVDARKYLLNRNINREVSDEFSIGYADSQWNSLLNLFKKKRIDLDLAEKTGLIINKNGRFYDRFRNRIMFPVFNIRKEVIGFGGRVLDDSKPKYLNSPESILFDKKKTLYGIEKAKECSRKAGEIFIVEGYTDVISLFKHGILNSVATLGTALSKEHVRLLKGFVKKIFLVYDSDAAGLSAAKKSIAIFNNEFVLAKFIVLKEGYDPDNFLEKFGVDSFYKASTKALDSFSFMMESQIKINGDSVEGKVATISELAAYLSLISDNLARSLYVKKIAEKMEISERVVLDKVNKKLNDDLKYNKPVKNDFSLLQEKANLTGMEKLEKKIIGMMLQNKKILPEIIYRKVIEKFQNKELKDLGKKIINFKSDDVNDFLLNISDLKQKSIIAAILIYDENWSEKNCFKLINQFEASHNIKSIRNSNDLLKQIKTAESKKDHKLLLKLLGDWQIQVNKTAGINVESAGDKFI